MYHEQSLCQHADSATGTGQGCSRSARRADTGHWRASLKAGTGLALGIQCQPWAGTGQARAIQRQLHSRHWPLECQVEVSCRAELFVLPWYR